jgi:hypothetical protein
MATCSQCQGIDGGVGAFHHALIDAGAINAVHVDVSADYIR